MTETESEWAEEDVALTDELAEVDPEAPEADVLEQARPVRPDDEPIPSVSGFEVDDYDAIEQRLVVTDEEDDYYR